MAAHSHYSGTTPFLQGLNDEQQKNLKALTQKRKLWDRLYNTLRGYHSEATSDSVRELANTRLFHHTTVPLDLTEPLDLTVPLGTFAEPLEYPAVDASRETVLFYYGELLYQHRCDPRVEVIFLLGALCDGPHKSVLPAPVSGKRTDQFFTAKDQRDAKCFHRRYVCELPAIAQWAIEEELPYTYLREGQLLYCVHALWSGTHTRVQDVHHTYPASSGTDSDGTRTRSAAPRRTSGPSSRLAHNTSPEHSPNNQSPLAPDSPATVQEQSYRHHTHTDPVTPLPEQEQEQEQEHEQKQSLLCVLEHTFALARLSGVVQREEVCALLDRVWPGETEITVEDAESDSVATTIPAAASVATTTTTTSIAPAQLHEGNDAFIHMLFSGSPPTTAPPP